MAAVAADDTSPAPIAPPPVFQKHKMPNATQRLVKEYEAAGEKYYMEEREYYSTGGVTFAVDPMPAVGANGPAIVVAGQYDRYILHAQPGQQANLFSYKIGDPMFGANITTTDGTLTRIADGSDTNLLEAYKTNDEDFAIRGIGIQTKGIRIEYEPSDSVSPGTPNITWPNDFLQVITNGTQYYEDPGSHITPPEVDSPLILSDVLGRAIMKRLRLKEVWNNRATDDIALGRGLGPGGSETYLKTMGEPATHNLKRLDPGLIWRRQSGTRDTKFNLLAEMLEDIWMIASWPQSVLAVGTPLGPPTFVHVDFQIVLIGHAFYYPSENT